jgi:hypothetical protein
MRRRRVGGFAAHAVIRDVGHIVSALAPVEREGTWCPSYSFSICPRAYPAPAPFGASSR